MTKTDPLHGQPMTTDPSTTRAAEDFCAGCAIECLCDVSGYDNLSDAELDAIAALDVNLADDTSIEGADRV